jgi:hypothetical protein
MKRLANMLLFCPLYSLQIFSASSYHISTNYSGETQP